MQKSRLNNYPSTTTTKVGEMRISLYPSTLSLLKNQIIAGNSTTAPTR